MIVKYNWVTHLRTGIEINLVEHTGKKAVLFRKEESEHQTFNTLVDTGPPEGNVREKMSMLNLQLW